MKNSKLIELERISFSYNGSVVLEDISLVVEKRDFIAILGPNGSGKTTLLKIITGLFKPIAGSVRVFGQTFDEFNQYSKIGYVPQKATQFNSRFPATVEEVISTGLFSQKGLFKRITKEDKQEVSLALKVVGLEGFERKMINSLSGGQQQRIFIARALCNKPELLILDEPTVGLDCKSQGVLYNFLDELNRSLGITIVLVSHDIGVVSSKVNKVICLNKQLLFHGSPKDLHFRDLSLIYDEPLIPFVHHI